MDKETLDAVAALLSGTSINQRGKASKVKVNAKQNAMQSISLSDLKAGNAQRVQASEVIPDNAMSTVADLGQGEREYHIYPAMYEGTKGVKCTFMPFRKQFNSVATLRAMVNPEIQALIREFLESLD